MPTNNNISTVIALLSDKWVDIKVFALLMFSFAAEFIGLSISMTIFQDFVTWIISTITAAVGVYFVWIQVQIKRIELKKKKDELNKDNP